MLQSQDWRDIRNAVGIPLDIWLKEQRATILLGNGTDRKIWDETIGATDEFERYIRKRWRRAVRKCLRPANLREIKELPEWVEASGAYVFLKSLDTSLVGVYEGFDGKYESLILIAHDARARTTRIGCPGLVRNDMIAPATVGDIIHSLVWTWNKGADTDPDAKDSRSLLCDGFASIWKAAGSPHAWKP